MVNGTSIGGSPWLNVANGSQNLTGLAIANGDLVEVLAEDADGNRQWYEKTGKQLKVDCGPKIQPAEPVPVPVTFP
jgi:hypothetical protein